MTEHWKSVCLYNSRLLWLSLYIVTFASGRTDPCIPAEHIEAMDQQQAQSPRRSSTVSPSPSCNSNDSHSGADNGPAGAQDRVSFTFLTNPQFSKRVCCLLLTFAFKQL